MRQEWLILLLALALPEFAETTERKARDGGPVKFAVRRDSGACPLRGRRGWFDLPGGLKQPFGGKGFKGLGSLLDTSA
jgi:hypothetical protein